VTRLNSEITRAVRTPSVAQHLQERGLVPLTGTPADFARAFEADVQKWSGVMRSAHIKLE
jgi:tripartite-type tricarboxylate transporter receptor subunit TctC